MAAERGGNMEGGRMSEQAAFIATVLAVFENAGSRLTEPEKQLIRFIARQVFAGAEAKGEQMSTAVQRRLRTYERVAQALKDGHAEGLDIPAPFRVIDPDRLLELVAALAANIPVFEQVASRSRSPS